MIFAVFDVLLAVNMCINYSFFTFIFAVLLPQNIFKIYKSRSRISTRRGLFTKEKKKCLALSVQLYALVLAINVVRHSREQNFIIFSDSKSSLEAISNFQIEVDLVQKFTKEYTLLSNNGKNILLCWIPSHTGIRGNEKADTAAKAALSLSVTPMTLPASEIFPHVNKLISEDWQQIWDNCTGNKLRCIQPTV